MTVLTLDAKKLYLATLAGCHAVVREREALNAINVFPVQDGDTGDNMTATANAVIHHASLQQSIKKTLQSVANASMTGARGNSGMIFSQFFNALAEHAVEEEAGDQLNIHRFNELLHHAARRMRAAILNPVDGTMLTIMERWSLYMHEYTPHMSCFKTVLQTITTHLQEAVAQTTHTLAALKQANVVDAGALGFFHFINGFSRFIADPSSIHVDAPAAVLPAASHDHTAEHCLHEPPQEGRYCTEAFITGTHLQSEALMDILKKQGESVVLSTNPQLCRFHLHTDTPWATFQALREVGQLQQPKIDDMLRQFQTLHARQHSIALVTDTNADLPQALCDKYQIHMMPLHIRFQDHDFIDKYGLASQTFYEQLSQCEQPPKTACPSAWTIEQKIKPIATQYEHVLVFSIARPLSGNHDVMKQACAAYPNVHVIDSKLCSAAQGLVLSEMGERLTPETDIQTVLQDVESLISRTHFWFMVHDLTALIRSGRMSKLMGKVAKLSGVKPLFTLTPEGKVHLSGKALSNRQALQKILKAIQTKQQNGAVLKRYAIVHANVPEAAEQFAAVTTALFQKAPDYIETVSVAVGVHTGPGCVGIAAIFE